MNCTNLNTTATATTEIPPLKAKCNRAGIHVPGDNPTPSEIIPIIQQRLAAHQNHPARNENPWTGDYAEWKAKYDDLTNFLTELHAAAQPNLVNEERVQDTLTNPNAGGAGRSAPAASVHKIPEIPPPPRAPTSPADSPKNNISPQNAGLSESTVAPQHNPAESNVSSGESDVSSAEFPVSSAESKLTSIESNSPNLQPLTTNQPTLPVNDQDNATLQQRLATVSLKPALDLQRYLSGRSPLDNLNPHQQEAILLLLEDHPAWRVAEIIAPPPPIGFGLQTTDASINRFRGRIAAAKCQALRDQDATAMSDLLSQIHSSDEAFQTAVQTLLKDRLVRAASQAGGPGGSLGVVDSIITSLNKLRKQALAERKQIHAEKSKKTKTTP